MILILCLLVWAVETFLAFKNSDQALTEGKESHNSENKAGLVNDFRHFSCLRLKNVHKASSPLESC